MKLVLAHSYYGSGAPSGENLVFEAERRLLEERGHEVIAFTRHSDVILGRGARGLLQGALSCVWNPFAVRALRALLLRERPDVLHVHNTFPLLSPAVFRAARGLATATVLTLHNYRAFCASALVLRDEQPCTLCLDRRSVLPALRHGCYRGSRLATLPLAASIALHRRLATWTRDVDAFVALTGFQRELLVRAGLRGDRVEVKANFHPRPPAVVPWAEREPRAMFVGRLSREKGPHVLLEAWRAWGPGAPLLEIAGDGPDRAALERQAAGAGLGDRVRFLGYLPAEEVERRLSRCRLLVVPSLWFEGFPLVVREALACGVPLAASRLGSLEEIVGQSAAGASFAAGDAADLARVVAGLWADPGRLVALSAAARAYFEVHFTAERSHERLLGIYAVARTRRAAVGG